MKFAEGGMMDEGDFYENLSVYVQGKGEIYEGTSMSEAVSVANSYMKKYPNAEITIVDEKYGDEYDFDGNMKEEYAKGGTTGKEYMVFNYTDDIYASNDVFKTKKEANDFIKSFRKRYEGQGYYRDNRMNKIDIEDIDLMVIPSDFNPFPYRGYAKGGEMTYKMTEEKIYT
jgi:hypothetical protein